MPMTFRGQTKIVYVIWVTLVLAALVALVTARWTMVFVSLATLVFSMLPVLFVERFKIRLPVSFFTGIVIFVFAAIFLGEAFDFYGKYWWWDALLHGVSAIGFGLTGFVFVFMLFEGDRFAAPPLAIAFVAYCFAITMGVSWEIFEFAMDQVFGLHMQKSGLVDTMWDLIVDAIGSSVGAWAGFFYLKGREFGGLSGMIAEFVRLNGRLFKKIKIRK